MRWITLVKPFAGYPIHKTFELHAIRYDETNQWVRDWSYGLSPIWGIWTDQGYIPIFEALRDVGHMTVGDEENNPSGANPSTWRIP